MIPDTRDLAFISKLYVFQDNIEYMVLCDFKLPKIEFILKEYIIDSLQLHYFMISNNIAELYKFLRPVPDNTRYPDLKSQPKSTISLAVYRFT